MNYELVEFYCTVCNSYNNIGEGKLYNIDYIECSTCKTKLSVDLDFDKNYEEITNIKVEEYDDNQI